MCVCVISCSFLHISLGSKLKTMKKIQSRNFIDLTRESLKVRISLCTSKQSVLNRKKSENFSLVSSLMFIFNYIRYYLLKNRIQRIQCEYFYFPSLLGHLGSGTRLVKVKSARE